MNTNQLPVKGVFEKWFVGSTGDPPVPSGDSPTGVGGSPAPPIFKTGAIKDAKGDPNFSAFQVSDRFAPISIRSIRVHSWFNSTLVRLSQVIRPRLALLAHEPFVRRAVIDELFPGGLPIQFSPEPNRNDAEMAESD